MITRIQASRYRCLRYVDQRMSVFKVLVGPNASGKTTFLDTIAFVGDLLSDGLDAAVEKRTGDFRDLVWNHGGDCGFELAVEAKLPSEICEFLPQKVGVTPDPHNPTTSQLEKL